MLPKTATPDEVDAFVQRQRKHGENYRANEYSKLAQAAELSGDIDAAFRFHFRAQESHAARAAMAGQDAERSIWAARASAHKSKADEHLAKLPKLPPAWGGK
jgi:hypothetical protein